MQFFAAVLTFCYIITYVQGVLDRKQAISTLENCKAELNATEDPEVILDKEYIPQTYEGKCMLACAMEKYGTMKDGKIHFSGLKAFLDEHYMSEPETYTHMLQGYTQCEEGVKGLEDKCELASAYLTCGLEAGIHFR